MNATEFQEYFKSFPYFSPFFQGVFAADEIPRSLKENHFIICNTDLSTGLGIHWYCLLRLNDCLECFDSLGVDESKKQFIITLPLVQKIGQVELNKTQVQSLHSNTCGQFVIYFLIQRLHNKDLNLNDLLNEIFTVDKEKNEIIVKTFLKTHFENDRRV